ncbi:MFS transporter [Kineosporia babensis]|uniref:MFS transporter n=1 Tax=Kineosporia babensis TaxID=499548 RepID=A0A9X1NBQ2_9ACTN|nr:MFS transporter [Kineosporia babensis]
MTITETRRTTLPLVLLAGLLLIAFVMRAPFISVAPAIADIQAALDIDSATAGLFTTLPVICFGLATPLVLVLTRRSGINNSMHIALAVVLAGIVLRSAGGLGAALAGTVVIGLGITIANVVVPVIIGRDFAGRTTEVTGFYTAAMNLGAMTATTLGAPLAGWLTWRWALLTWALVVLLAALAWKRATPVTQESAPPEPTGVPSSKTPMNRRLVAGMVFCFAGQSFSYYGVTAWLPTLLADQQSLSATQAGGSASLFQMLALVSAFGLPWAIRRGLSSRAALLLVCTCWISLPLGLAFAPALWVLWSCLGGFAQGGGFTVIFSVVVARALNSDDARRMSATVQGVGYILGALGPIIVGAVHAATGSWVPPMLLVAGMIVVMAVGGSLGIGARPTGTAASR